ncbi:hypothetical protein CLAFUW4_07078 [Fulvia fulva]|nr:hypothetical protein CLAFUR4_07087 [Fulvia fulva]WPV16302.1 hypothetical protein CLAFUW4_07078 [Fulvia fulva]
MPWHNSSGWDYDLNKSDSYDPLRTQTNVNATATPSIFYELRKQSQHRKRNNMITPETSPRSHKRRRSEDEPERKPVDDQGLEKERNEDMPAFVKRIKDNKGDMIPVYIEKNEEPVFVQRAFLSRISPKIKKKIEQNMGEDGTRNLHLEAPAPVVKLFLFWLFHDRVPSFKDLSDLTPPDTSDYETREQYQIILIKAWVWANDKELPAMQNAIMRHFFDEIDVQILSEDVLQEGLLKTRAGMRMRKALLEELVWLEDHTIIEDDDDDDGNLLEHLNVTYVYGFDQDCEEAIEACEKRCKKRGTAGDYLVKEA